MVLTSITLKNNHFKYQLDRPESNKVTHMFVDVSKSDYQTDEVINLSPLPWGTTIPNTTLKKLLSVPARP